MKRVGQIPSRVRAEQALVRGGHYAGTIPVERLSRLATVVANPSGVLDVDLHAERDGQGQAWLRGNIRGALPLNCQRGLHPFEWRVALNVELRLVNSEAEEARLLKTCDPYWVQDDELPLWELVEDEVLLALPMMARCEDPECAQRLR
jgi:uncharacterized protein